MLSPAAELVTTVVSSAAALASPSSPVPWTRNAPPASWPAAKLAAGPIAFVLASPASRDLGAEAAGELDVATRVWGAVACSGFRARYAGVSTTAVAADDGVNAVYIHDDVWPAELPRGVAAHTVVSVDGDGAIHDADIHLNGVDYRFSLDGARAAGTVDVRSVLVHELGHALGLGHSTDPRATMFATYAPGIAWRSLEADDRAGVCALYPGKGAAACDATTACPASFVCVAAACERVGGYSVTCAPCQREVGACDGAGDGARCIDVGATGPSAAGDSDSAGRVCAAPCGTAADCAEGFACRATTSSGDLQCVPTAVDGGGCAPGAFACTGDSDCGGDVCFAGACVGRIARPSNDGGAALAEGGADAADGGSTSRARDDASGCAVTRAPTRGRGAGRYLAIALVVVALARRRRDRAR